MKCHWMIRCLLGVIVITALASGSAVAQQGGGGGDTGGGGTGGGGTGGGGTGSGGTGSGGTGGTNTGTQTSEANVTDNTEESAISETLDRVMNVSGDRARNLRDVGIGRVGVVNVFGTGNPDFDGETITMNATTGAGPVGAGVRFRNAQGQSRYATSTTTSRGTTTGGAAGAGRTATGLGGAGGAQGLNNAFGGTGGLGAQGSTTSARIPLLMGDGLKMPAATPRSSNLVSAQIRSLPLLARSPQVQVQTEGNVVTLSGSLATQRESEALVRALKMRSGVGSVVNRIVVREQNSPSDRPQ